ncbi:MAG: monovalent cation/H+ antiporter subunit D family protein [Planctomycetes bacterium]|jgi:multicomponent Na+:H+ antiporter subunit D|nr:monovalent cation/H+ antiporter subunit D family protein [Planctomycetota bacterium]MCL4729924.1 monovalent cation/H+ antiporter subunit D family protein [Planctomycetota bacterium]
MSPELTVLLAVGLPLVGTLLIVALGRWPNLRDGVTVVTSLAVFSLVASLLPAVLAGRVVEAQLGLNLIPGVPVAFRVEPLGMVYALVASLLWIPNSVYAFGYMRGNHEKHQTRFFACFPVAIASAVGIAFAENIFTMFLFYEVLTFSTVPLVTHKGSSDAMRSGRVYLGVLLTTSVCLQLFAVLWIYVLYRQGVLPGIGFVRGGLFGNALAAGAVSAQMLGLLFFLYIYGIGKSALMPMHKWLPAAMVAPTPVSAFLHAVAVVKAGVFCVVKVIVYVFGVETLRLSGQSAWLVYVSGGTILAASLIALFQDNLKKRLAYSTISQLSYVIMAAALLTPVAIMAATVHIIAHALGKITLFFAAGSVYTAAHKTQVSQLDGIGRRMPWTMAAFTIGALSMIGVPPVVGFISKWTLLRGVVESAQLGGTRAEELFALCVIALSTLLNAGYFAPIIYRAFFRPPSPEDEHHPHGEAPVSMVFALCTTAGLVLLFFVWPRALLTLGAAVMEAAT